MNTIQKGTIIDFTHDGLGVMRTEEGVVFVRGAVIGDSVTAKIVETKKTYKIAEIVSIDLPSKDRVNDDSTNGGIFALINYRKSEQHSWKEKRIKTALEKIGKINSPIVSNIIVPENEDRNNIQIAVSNDGEDMKLGFFIPGTNEVDAVDLNKILSQDCLEIINCFVKTYSNSIKAYNWKTRKGSLSNITIRSNKKGQIMLIFVTRDNSLIKIEGLINALKGIDVEEKLVSIYQNIKLDREKTRYGDKYIKLWGEDYITEEINQIKYQISPESFFQVNTDGAKIIFDTVNKLLKPKQNDTIFDIYCGTGSISLQIAKHCKKVWGIESVKSAIKDAKANAILNNIGNVKFIKGDAKIETEKLLSDGIKANKIVLDPPRKGVDKTLILELISISPKKIVYVSCDPETLARDLKLFVEGGYVIEEIVPIDMFPNTAHVECVTMLTREK